MEIKPIYDVDLVEYDKFVDVSTEGTLFHKSWWLSIFKNYYGTSYEIKIFGAFENGNLIGAIPIPIFHRYWTKFVYVPKLTPYLGSVFVSNKGEKTCTKISREKKINEKFADIIKQSGLCLLYPFSHGFIDLQPFKWNGFETGVNYTYLIKSHDLNEVMNGMDKKRRNDITKCSKEKYIIKTGRIEDHIQLTNQTMRRQHQPQIEKMLILHIFEECKKNNAGETFTIYNEASIPSASLMLVWDTKRSYYLSGGFGGNSRGHMSLLILEAIRYTKEKLNLPEFDFEGSDVKNIEFFFREFGGNLIPIYFIHSSSIMKTMLMKAHKLCKKVLPPKLYGW